MTASINWPTGEITVPKADTTLLAPGPLGQERRALDVDALRLDLRTQEASEPGRAWPKTHDHNTTETLGGVTYQRLFKLLAPYFITFENGNYAVELNSANNNILDRTTVNNVQVRERNSAGAQVVTQEVGVLTALDQERLRRMAQLYRRLHMDALNPTDVTPTGIDATDIDINITGDGINNSSFQRVIPSPAPNEVSGCVGWWDGGDTETMWQNSARSILAYASGQPIAAWDDKSGQGNHLVQSDSNLRPLVQAQEIALRPGLFFDNVNDFFDLTTAITVDEFTMFFVLKPDAVSLEGLASRADNVDYVRIQSATQLRVKTTQQVDYTIPNWSVDTPRLVTIRRTPPGNVDVRTDGVERDTGVNTGPFTFSKMFKDNPYGGHVLDAAIFNTDLANADRDALEAYFNAKWGVY